MSWDNVAGVSSAQIWTDNPDMTQAWLFANGSHQVKLTIGISFNLTDKTQPGPTQDEVSAALTLINYKSGAGISYLKAGAAGDYLASYLPNTAPTVKQAAAADTGHFQYEILYYLSSDSTINPSYMSESVALLLTYTNKDGQEIEYSTASNSKSQSYVAVTVYPPKQYGISNSNSNSTPITITLIDDKPDQKVVNKSQYVEEISECDVKIFRLNIDDSYFRIISFEGSDELLTGNPFNINGSSELVKNQPYSEFKITEHYICKDNLVNQGSNSYSTQFNFNYNDSGTLLFTDQVTVFQQPNEIIFFHVWAHIYADNENYSNHSGSLSFYAYDQFGNKMDIEVTATNDGFNISSVV